MKRELVVCFAVVLFSISFAFAASCDDSQVIMRLYSSTNSHVAFWNSSVDSYVEEVCHDDIFGWEYTGNNPHECTGSNRVLSLSSLTNAHASITDDAIYSNDVCYGNLACSYDNSSGDSCENGGEVVARFYGESNSHVSYASDTNYPIKVCCNNVGAYWANMNGEQITEADFGDMVQLISRATSSGTFNIKEADLLGDDEIRSIEGESRATDLVARWTIETSDLDESEAGDYEEFFFEIDGEVSDFLNIDENGDDSPMTITIVSPVCGEYYDEGDTMGVLVLAEDEDDLIDGTVKINGNEYNFTNGGISFDEILSESGNVQVLVEASNSRGAKSRGISNVMVLDKEGESYVDGDYVAACIKEPRDFSNIPGSIVGFDASTTRGIRITGGEIDELIPGEDSFSWYWTFYPQGFERNLIDTVEQIAYKFTAEFPVAGDNSASLRVEV